MTHIFVSYKRDDLPIVQRLVDELKRHHFVWFDQTGIPGGTDWEQKINDALDKAAAVVLMLSPEALKSDWVRYEYMRAIQKNCKLIPLMIAPCQLPDELRNLQMVDNNLPDAFERLMKALPDSSRIWGDGLVPENELNSGSSFEALAAKFPKGVLHPTPQLIGLPIRQSLYSRLYLIGKAADTLEPLDSFQLAIQLNSRNFSLTANPNGAYPQDEFAAQIAEHFLTSPSKRIRLFLLQGPLNQPYDQSGRLDFGLKLQHREEWEDIVHLAHSVRGLAKSKLMQLFINGPGILSYQLGEMNAQYLRYELYQYDRDSFQYYSVLKS